MKHKVEIEDIRHIYWDSSNYYVRVLSGDYKFIDSVSCKFFPEFRARMLIKKYKKESKYIDKSRKYEVEL